MNSGGEGGGYEMGMFTSGKNLYLVYGDFKFTVNHMIKPHLHT